MRASGQANFLRERGMAFKRKFNGIYRKIKLMLYRSMFKRIKDTDESLTSSEFFCLECIYLMDKPTISQFAEFLDISSPNATYKIKSLIKKGLITKERSSKDGREFLLVPTQKFFDFYEKKDEENSINIMKKSMSKSESKKMDKILSILTEKN